MGKVFIFAYNECFQNKKITESKIVKLWIFTVGNHQRGEISFLPKTNYSYSISVTNICVATI